MSGNYLRKTMSFVLVLALVLGSLGISGWGIQEAYGAEGVNVSVRIETSTGTALSHTELAVENFDMSPFITGDLGDFTSPESGVMTGHALIEGVYYLIYGEDPTVTDLDVAADSATATAIKENLNLYIGDYGLSTGSVFGDTTCVSSYVNDAMPWYGLAEQTIVAGDRIVFCQYTVNFSYFDILGVDTRLDYGYPVLDLSIRMNGQGYDAGWNIVTAPVANMQLTENGVDIWSGITDEFGKLNTTLYAPGYTTEPGVYTTDISAACTEAYVPPFCRIVWQLEEGATEPEVISISQGVVTEDVSLDVLDLQFTEGEPINGLNYLGENTLTVGNTMDSVSISAIGSAEEGDNAEDKGNVYVEVEYLAPSSTEYTSPDYFKKNDAVKAFDLAVGANKFKFTVTNGNVKDYSTVTIVRKEASESVSDSEVNTIINGIKSHGASSYGNSADWMLAKAFGSLEISAKEKNDFLTYALVQAQKPTDGSSIGTQAKVALALTAMGIDPRRMPDDDEEINLIEKITTASSSIDTIDAAYSAPFVLSLYNLPNYAEEVGAATLTEEALISKILSAQNSEGAWTPEYGLDGTGMVLPALAPYYEKEGYEAVTSAVNKALDYLSDVQNVDGSFPGFGGSANSNTQAYVITGLNALSITCHTDVRFIKSGMSAMDHLLSYKTANNALGYTNNLTANDLACQQGLGTFVTYKKLMAGQPSNLYNFSKEVSVYTQWPDAKLLTSIMVTPPTKVQYTYDENDTAHSIDTAGMVVKAVYNNDASTTTTVAIEDCTVSTIDLSKAGTQTVTVTYKGETGTFTVKVLSAEGEQQPEEQRVSVKVKIGNKVLVSDNVVIEEGRTSVMDVLKTTLNKAGIKYVIQGNNYIVSINDKGEFDEGRNSGWLYSVDGVTPPTTAANDYKLDGGEVVLWYFTEDYTKDPSSSQWTGEEVVEEVTEGAITVPAITAAAIKTFDDVSEDAWYYECVTSLAAMGIINGRTENTFAPNDSITRAEFVTILAKLSGKNMPAVTDGFTDVNAEDWFAKYVTWAADAGIVYGTSADKFSPNAKITRQDMAVMIKRYADYMKQEISGTNTAVTFTDATSIASYAKDAVVVMQKAGIINGIKIENGSYSFAPANNATRAQAATMIYKLIK